jgi:hypothetical protein
MPFPNLGILHGILESCLRHSRCLRISFLTGRRSRVEISIQDRLLCSWVLTDCEINLASSSLNFVRQAVPVPLVFLNYYRPGLLFANFGDAKTLVPAIVLEFYPGGAGFCQYPALDSFSLGIGGGGWYSGGEVASHSWSHLQGFPTFKVRYLQVPEYLQPSTLLFKNSPSLSPPVGCSIFDTSSVIYLPWNDTVLECTQLCVHTSRGTGYCAMAWILACMCTVLSLNLDLLVCLY